MVEISAEKIKRLGIIQQFKTLLSKSTGLDIEIIPSENIENGKNCFPCSDKKKGFCKNSRSFFCNRINKNISDKLNSSRNTRQLFSCPGERTKIVMPLTVHNRDVGVLFVGENALSPFKKTRMQKICKSLHAVCSYLVQNEINLLNTFTRNLHTYQQEKLNKVIEYLRENCNRSDLRLTEVARNNGISYHYLSHLFKKGLSTTFVKYRSDMRMKLAFKLLQDFRLTVKQVADSCGYDDPSYFCKVFKATYSFSPGRFRIKIRKMAKSKKIP